MSSITTSLLHGESPIDEIEFEWEAPPTAPESFDCRINWPDLMVGITNQLNCGACWAFTAATAAADRFAIAGVTREVLSPQELLSCDKKSSGCLGGNSKNAHTYMVRPGITTQSCIPFVSGEGRVPICPTRCSNGSKIERFRFASMASYTKNNVMDAVVSDGPIYFPFNVYPDFKTYKSGVYQRTVDTPNPSGHAAVLLGWGVENDVPFWLCQNSWGSSWGENGYFRIKRGSNECGCEQSFYYAGKVA